LRAAPKLAGSAKARFPTKAPAPNGSATAGMYAAKRTIVIPSRIRSAKIALNLNVSASRFRNFTSQDWNFDLAQYQSMATS